MDIKKCLEEGFLKKVKPNKKEIEKEIKESRSDLKDARFSFKMGKYKWCTIQAYYSMFHAARSVLISQGFKERRHFAICVVLESLTKNKKLEAYFVDDFKAAMFAREEADYESYYSKERAEQVLATAEEFYERMRKLLKSVL